MGKKDNSPAISFFSFQDIITSITGIMFLVVMMLVLMILQQPSSVKSKAEQEVQESVKKLEEDIAKMKKDLAELAKQDLLRKKRLEELKKLNMEQLPAIKKKLISALEKTDMLLLQMNEDEHLFLKKQKEAALEKEKLLVKMEETAIKNKEDEKAAKEKERQIQKEEKLLNKYKNIVKFVWDKNNQKKPVILECSEKTIIAVTLEENSARRSFSGITECMSWCRTHSVNDTYFILLLKPSAFSYGEKLSRDLQKAGFERGREIVPDEKSIITFGKDEAGK